jgi:hypothetical protein
VTANPAEFDSLLDALALVEASRRADSEARKVILDHADLRRTAAWLAWIVDDLIEDLTIWHEASAEELLSRLRAGWAGDGGGGD